MNKLFFIAGITIAMASCKESSLKKGTGDDVSKKAYNNMTLNGLTKDSATRLIENYNNSASLPIPAGTFFLNKDLLKKIVAVLSEEQSKDASVDGLRIYFG